MITYYYNAELATGNNDGTSEANAWQLWATAVAALSSMTDDVTLYMTSNGTTALYLSINGIVTNGYSLTLVGTDGSVFRNASSFNPCMYRPASVTGKVTYQNIIIRCVTSGGCGIRSVTGGGDDTYFTNCVVIGAGGSSSYGFNHYGSASGSNGYADHCISVGTAYGFQNANIGAFDVYNSYASAAISCYIQSGSGDLTLYYSASTDTTGSSGLQSLAYDTTVFTNVTSGSEDFNLVAGSPLIGAGTSTSTLTDIDGDTYGDPPSVGAHAYVITYTVTYNGNGSDGGSVPVDGSSPYVSGSTVTVLGNTGSLTLTGYIFVCWNTNSGGTGTNYIADATFTITADTTLYALWKTEAELITAYLTPPSGGYRPRARIIGG